MSQLVQVGSNQFTSFDKQAERDAAHLPEPIQYEPKASLASLDGLIKRKRQASGQIWTWVIMVVHSYLELPQELIHVHHKKTER